MLKINLYSLTSEKVGSLSLPAYFNQSSNMALLAQAIYVYRARLHKGLAKTKTRGEVSLTTKKWYRQKGTGRARHGAQSAPIFVGGGVAHGPSGRKRTLVLPKKMRRRALEVSLSLKVKNKKLAAVTGFSGVKKTKDIKNLIDRVIKGEKLDPSRVRMTFVLSAKNKNSSHLIANLGRVKSVPFQNLNVYHAYFGGFLLFDQEIFAKNET